MSLDFDPKLDAVGPIDDDDAFENTYPEPDSELTPEDAVGPTGDEDLDDSDDDPAPNDQRDLVDDSPDPAPALKGGMQDPAEGKGEGEGSSSEDDADIDPIDLARRMLGIEEPAETPEQPGASAAPGTQPDPLTALTQRFDAIEAMLRGQAPGAAPPSPPPGAPPAVSAPGGDGSASQANVQQAAWDKTVEALGPPPQSPEAAEMWNRVYTRNFHEAHQQSLRTSFDTSYKEQVQQELTPVWRALYQTRAEYAAQRAVGPGQPQEVIDQISKDYMEFAVKNQREPSAADVERIAERVQLSAQRNQQMVLARMLEQMPAAKRQAIAKVLADDRAAQGRPKIKGRSQAGTPSRKPAPSPARGTNLPLSEVLRQRLAGETTVH